MIHAVTDLREGPESRQTIEYRKVVRCNGRIVSNEEARGRPPPIVELDTLVHVISVALREAK